MTTFSRQVVVEYTTEQMYALVSDVNSYAKFIPLITTSRILAVRDNQLRAAFKIANGPLGFEFTTVNTFEKYNYISMNLENGPFKAFNGVWRFTPLARNRSSISLFLEFEFSSKILCFILEGLFDQLCNTMIDAFLGQAAALYDNNQSWC